MGTSSARRGPTTRLWRAAKGAATRYLSPNTAAAVTAGEVVGRYLAALGETSAPGAPDALAAFRGTRRVAQDLGAWAAAVNARGWDTALEECGLGELRGQPREIALAGLSTVLSGSGGGLEDAVGRTALATILGNCPEENIHTGPGRQPETRLQPGHLVRQFLAAALNLRLALDLGESLEAAAGSWSRHREGLTGLEERISEAAAAFEAPSAAPRSPAEWRGLAGWTWVTRVMAALLQRLRAGESPSHAF